MSVGGIDGDHIHPVFAVQFWFLFPCSTKFCSDATSSNYISLMLFSLSKRRKKNMKSSALTSLTARQKFVSQDQKFVPPRRRTGHTSPSRTLHSLIRNVWSISSGVLRYIQVAYLGPGSHCRLFLGIVRSVWDMSSQLDILSYCLVQLMQW
jgi:hypothetical protein